MIPLFAQDEIEGLKLALAGAEKELETLRKDAAYTRGSRDDFEAWYRREYGTNAGDFSVNESGRYMVGNVRFAWHAWQAGRVDMHKQMRSMERKNHE